MCNDFFKNIINIISDSFSYILFPNSFKMLSYYTVYILRLRIILRLAAISQKFLNVQTLRWAAKPSNFIE